MTSLWEIQEDEAARHRAAMTDTNTSGADLLAIKRAARIMHDDRQQEVVVTPPADWERHLTAVAALIEREAALAKRVAELEADAGRYQLLRDAEKCRAMPSGRIGLITGNFGEDLDAAIDAARAEARNV